MRQEVRIFTLNLIALFIIISFFWGLFYVFARTSHGSWFLTKLALSAVVGARQVEFESVSGTLLSQLTYKHIEIKEVPWLAPGTVIKVQQLDVRLDAWRTDGLWVSVQNGRLFLSDTDVILFYGDYRAGDLHMNAYSKNVNVRGVLSLFSKSPSLMNTRGTVMDLDIALTGDLYQPSLNGTFYLSSLETDAFSLQKCPGRAAFTLTNVRTQPELFGEVIIAGGSISRPRSAVVALGQSKILFKGDPRIPYGQIAGTALVENTRIRVALNGPLRRPDITFTSDPPRPESMLAMMLMTNRGWSATEQSAQQAKLSPEMASDFIDYFLFDGPGREISRQLGIRNVSLYLDETRRGIGVVKEVGRAVDMTYQIEQTQESEISPIETTQLIGGSVKVHENIVVQAEQEITQDTTKAEAGEKPVRESTIWLKFKRGF